MIVCFVNSTPGCIGGIEGDIVIRGGGIVKSTKPPPHSRDQSSQGLGLRLGLELDVDIGLHCPEDRWEDGG